MQLQVFNKKDKTERDRDRQQDGSQGHPGLEQRTITDEEGKDPISGAKEIQRELALLADKAGDTSMSKIDIWYMLFGVCCETFPKNFLVSLPFICPYTFSLFYLPIFIMNFT